MTAADALLDELTALAAEAAVAAGALLRDERPGTLRVGTKSSPTDVVTQMDRAAEELLVDRLLTARPGDGVLGEEGGERSGTSGVRWVLDPLDGTVNYLYGLPLWGVSVAAEVDGEVVVGVIDVPEVGETYVAVRGRGALLRDRSGERRLEVADPAGSGGDLDRALVGTGFGYTAARRRSQAAVVAALLPRVRDIRRMGAASVDLCAVAAGRLDGYFERGLQPWDLAAGALVVREAGGSVGGLRGVPAGETLTVAARPALFGPLHDLLVELDADRDLAD